MPPILLLALGVLIDLIHAETCGGTEPHGLAVLLALLLPLTLYAAARWTTARTTRRLVDADADRLRVLRAFRRHRRLLNTATVLGYGVLVFLVHWPEALRPALGRSPHATLLRIGALLPFVLSVAAVRIALAGAEAALRGSRRRSRGEILLQLRQVSVPLLPFVLFLALDDIHRDIPGVTAALRAYPSLANLFALVFLALLFLLSPWVLRLLWPSRPLQRGPLRDRLLDLARLARVRVKDILVLDTGAAALPNACVVGLWAPFRHVLLTDELLATLQGPEIDAVFAHEAGHARRHHLLVNLAFLVAFLLTVDAADARLSAAFGAGPLASIATILLGMTVGLLLFGALSKQLERDADLFAASVLGSPAPLAAALAGIAERTGAVGGRLSTWRHDPVPRRIALLRGAALDPVEARRARFRTNAALSLVLVALGLGVGAFALRSTPDIGFYLGNRALRAGDAPRAEALFERVLAVDARPEVHYALGRARLARGDEQGARAAFGAALAGEDRHEYREALRRLGPGNDGD